MEIILALSTILGGVAALWFFWDKIRWLGGASAKLFWRLFWKSGNVARLRIYHRTASMLLDISIWNLRQWWRLSDVFRDSEVQEMLLDPLGPNVKEQWLCLKDALRRGGFDVSALAVDAFYREVISQMRDTANMADEAKEIARQLLGITTQEPARMDMLPAFWSLIRTYLEYVRLQTERLAFPGVTREVALETLFLPARVTGESELDELPSSVTPPKPGIVIRDVASELSLHPSRTEHLVMRDAA